MGYNYYTQRVFFFRSACSDIGPGSYQKKCDQQLENFDLSKPVKSSDKKLGILHIRGGLPDYSVMSLHAFYFISNTFISNI